VRPDSGATPVQPVGSTVDKVVIRPYRGHGGGSPAPGGPCWLEQPATGPGRTITA
jgi:hypothetical protein